ncbi:TPA: hypothetical protein SMN64_003478 [Proteus mirabilis]|nr:hypothetical protein [Proteus mirabilis]
MLIPDSEGIQAIKQQNQPQQAQLSTIKHTIARADGGVYQQLKDKLSSS